MTGTDRPAVGVALVATGGFAGATLRHAVAVVVPAALAATLAVNVLGCVALGFLFYGSREHDLVGERASLLLSTGFVSSFTTYSTFVVDAVESDPAIAAAYVLGTYALGFAGVLLGRRLSRLLGGGSRWR